MGYTAQMQSTQDNQAQRPPAGRKRADGAQLGYGALALMVLGTMFGGMLQNAINTVLPSIMGELSVSVGTAQWLVNSMQLCLGVVIPLVPFLARRFHVKALFLFSMALFAAGTFLIAAGDSFGVLFAGRVMEGISAGIAFPLIQVVVFQSYPRNRWGTIMGVVGLAFGFAPNVGPTVAGIFSDLWGWRSLFWLSAAAVSLLTVAMAFVLPRLRADSKAKPLDWLSVMLSTVGFGGILTALTNASGFGFASLQSALPLAVGAAALVAFCLRQLRIPNPLLDLRAFRNRDFTVGTIMVCLLFSSFIGVTLVLPVSLQSIHGFTELEAGLALFPGTIAALVMNPLSGVLLDRSGPRFIICLGSVLLLAGTIPFFWLDQISDLWLAMLLQGVRTFGISSLIQPISTWSVRSLMPPLVPDGTAISNTVRQVTGAFGTSIMVLLMSFGSATGDVTAFGADAAMFFSGLCSLALLVLAFAFVRR